jgi:hypothetical protein
LVRATIDPDARHLHERLHGGVMAHEHRYGFDDAPRPVLGCSRGGEGHDLIPGLE